MFTYEYVRMYTSVHIYIHKEMYHAPLYVYAHIMYRYPKKLYIHID